MLLFWIPYLFFFNSPWIGQIVYEVMSLTVENDWQTLRCGCFHSSWGHSCGAVSRNINDITLASPFELLVFSIDCRKPNNNNNKYNNSNNNKKKNKKKKKKNTKKNKNKSRMCSVDLGCFFWVPDLPQTTSSVPPFVTVNLCLHDLWDPWIPGIENYPAWFFHNLPWKSEEKLPIYPLVI